MSQSWNDDKTTGEPFVTGKATTPKPAREDDSKTGAAKQQAAAVADTTKAQADQVKNTAAGQAESVKQHAVAEAQNVKDTAVDSAQQVAETAKLEGAAVVGEAADQIRNLVDTTRGEVRDRAADGHRAVAGTVAQLSDELTRFSRGEATNGPVAQFAGQLAQRGESLSTWLQHSEPEDVLVEVRRFAARRPVAFLAIAAGAGVLAGRLARGTRDLAADQEQPTRARRVAGEPDVVAEQAYLSAPQGYVAPARAHEYDYEGRPVGYQQPVQQGLGEPGVRVDEGYVHTQPGQLGTPGQVDPRNGGLR